MKYRKKPVVIDATQWFKNGDHPEDNSQPYRPAKEGETVSDVLSEGKIVRYYRTPDQMTDCKKCGLSMTVHGWVDTLEGGHIACPGDFIITGVAGEIYPCKPGIFEKTYEKVG